MNNIEYLEVSKYINENKNIINKVINQFHSLEGEYERYTSFDYCYSYFYNFARQDNLLEIASPINIEKSCNILWGFLSSWGMLRGSTFLFTKNPAFLKPLIQKISMINPDNWMYDIESYSNISEDENTKDFFNVIEYLSSIIVDGLQENAPDFEPTDTLITKILLGIFSISPAIDQYFQKTLELGIQNGSYINKRNYMKVYSFYIKNKSAFDKAYKENDFRSYDFVTGQKQDITYNKIKLIDMFGFNYGILREKENLHTL